MSPPVIGAALELGQLGQYRDWLLEKQRDLELQSFEEAYVLNGDWRSGVEEARRHLEGHSGRLGIHGPFRGFSIATSDPDVRGIVARRLEQGLDVCEALGATQMVIHSPYTTWDHHNLADVPGSDALLVESVHGCIGAAVRRAEEQGVVLVMENIEDVDPHARRRLVESFGSAALRVSIDTGHAHYAHRSNGAPPVDHHVGAAGALLDHVHLQDADGYADRHWALGEGSVGWPAVFRAIGELGSRPRLLLELRDKSGIPASMRMLEAAGLGE